MVDIHTHVIPNVDDGSVSLQGSLQLIEDSIQQGVTDIILTPHHNSRYKPQPDKLRVAFEEFKRAVKCEGYDINLYLGQEVFMFENYKQLFLENKVLTLNDSEYILIEYDYNNVGDVTEIVYELVRLGYKPIVAHPERYDITVEQLTEIKNIGGYVQINASSVVENRLGKMHRKVVKFLKLGLVDFVASDVHCLRKNRFLSASKYIEKKYGKQVKEQLFTLNAQKIIKG